MSPKKQHATNPYYRRERRNGEAVIARAEKAERRRMARPLTDAEYWELEARAEARGDSPICPHGEGGDCRGHWMLTLAEAGAILGVDPSTLRHQIRNGRLKADKRGRDWMVDEAEVARYQTEHRRAAAA